MKSYEVSSPTITEWNQKSVTEGKKNYKCVENNHHSKQPTGQRENYTTGSEKRNTRIHSRYMKTKIQHTTLWVLSSLHSVGDLEFAYIKKEDFKSIT